MEQSRAGTTTTTMTLTKHVCKRCGAEFDAHPSAQTAKLGYCSQRCMTAVGK